MNTGQSGELRREDGFRVHITFGRPSNDLATHRGFAGVAGGAPSTAHVATTSTITDKTNVIGVAWLASLANMHSIENDGSGTATSVDLGSSYLADSLIEYKVELWCAAGGNVERRITNLNSGSSSSDTITTDLPATTEGLLIVVGCNSGTNGTGGEAGILIHKIEAWLGNWLVE
jgi:hypothetical protein